MKIAKNILQRLNGKKVIIAGNVKTKLSRYVEIFPELAAAVITFYQI